MGQFLKTTSSTGQVTFSSKSSKKTGQFRHHRVNNYQPSVAGTRFWGAGGALFSSFLHQIVYKKEDETQAEEKKKNIARVGSNSIFYVK